MIKNQLTEIIALQAQTKELVNQNVVLQKEKSSLESAARLIELVVIFYYVLKSWDSLWIAKNTSHLPAAVEFLVVAMFSVSMVTMAHNLGALRAGHKNKRLKLSLSIAALVIAFVLMIVLPLVYK